MTDLIPIALAVEGTFDERVLRKLIKEAGCPLKVEACHGKNGKQDLRKKIQDYRNAAEKGGWPFIVLVDLDETQCAPHLLQEWLPAPCKRLILRIAVHAVESWLLADRKSFAKYFSVSASVLPSIPEQIQYPKQEVVNLARRSRKREIREDIVPDEGSTSKIGKNYGGCLSVFVERYWSVSEARKNAPSLDKALNAINRFYGALKVSGVSTTCAS